MGKIYDTIVEKLRLNWDTQESILLFFQSAKFSCKCPWMV